MLRSTFLLLALLIGLNSFAQTWKQVDVLELKNGKKISGQILKHIPNQEVTLKSADSSIYVIPSFHIAVIRRQPYVYRKPAYQIEKKKPTAKFLSPQDSAERAEVYKYKGFSGMVQGNFIFMNSYGGRVFLGKLMNPYIILGLGTGVEKYTNFGNTYLRLSSDGIGANQIQEDYFIPAVVNVRFLTSKRRLSFTAGLQAGYSFYVSQWGKKSEYGSLVSENLYSKVQTGGFDATTSIGLRIFINKGTAFIYEVGVHAMSYTTRQTRLANPYASSGSFSSYTVYLANTGSWNVVPFISLGIQF